MSISGAFDNFRGAVHNTVSNVGNAVHSVAEKAGDAVGNVVSNAKEFVGDVKEKAGEFAGNVKEKAGEIKEHLHEDIVQLSEKAEALVDKADNWRSDNFDSDIDQLELDMDQAGVDQENVVSVAGTDGDDSIDICVGKDGSYTVTVNGEESTYTAEEAQRLMVSGGAGNDTITLHTEDGKSVPAEEGTAICIDGGDGDDTITADGALKKSLYITGGNGDDTITGGGGSDVIIDNYGRNTIDGGAGNDTITAKGKQEDSGLFGRVVSFFTGGKGDVEQTVEGGYGNDDITTGNGVDTITDKGGNDTIHAGGGDDTITVASGMNAIYGEDGNDTINGGTGRDYIEGGHGDDKIYGNDGGDVIYGGQGNDYIEGGEGDDFVNAGHGDDEVHGGNGNDTIFGLAGDDKLYGDDGRDTISAGAGNDEIDGGAGADTLRYTDSDKYGHDTVLNGDDADDAAALDPIKIPRNFINNPFETQAFKENMNDNLEAFASIEPGQNLLNGIAKTGHAVIFTSTDDANGYAMQMGWTGDTRITENADGTRTSKDRIGCSTLVSINPAFIDFNSSVPWSEQNTMVIMAHEMSHAYNNATGSMDESFYNTDSGELMKLPDGTSTEEGFNHRAVRGAEFQAVGIYDDKVTSANPDGISENDFRKYFHMAPRTSYMGENSTQYANSNHGGIDVDAWNEQYR